MATRSVIIGTVGRDVEVDTEIDLTEFDGETVELLVQDPHRGETTWACTFKGGDPTSGILVHTLALGDVDEPGTYKIHSHVANAAKDLKGGLTTLEVFSLFNSRR